MKKYNYNRVWITLVGSIIAFCSLLYTAHNTHADGEIILCPGEKYMIPCLGQLLSGQEYEIEIENPDIVGLDETGKCIVAVAPGTTEVTVRLMNPDSGYMYVFAVADVFGQPAAGIYVEPGENYAYEMYEGGMAEDERSPEDIPESHKYDEVSPSYQTDATGEEPGADEGHDEDAATEQGPGADTEQNAGNNTEQVPGIDTEQESDAGTEQSTGHYTTTQNEDMSWNADGEKPETKGQNDSAYGIEKAAGEAGTVPNDTEETEYLSYPPVYFTHGTGKYDTLVPAHYTLWICAHSRGPVSVLYVGVNGVPIRYRMVKKLICICSDDLPSGNCIIQVIAADAAGRVAVMEGYGAAKS